MLAASPALADDTVKPFGSTEQVPGGNGSEVTDFTVSNLRPSGNNDGIWSANVTAKAATGTGSPMIKDVNARAADGTNYMSILGPNANGLPAGPIPQGMAPSGKIYFDVNGGPPPDSVVVDHGGGSDQIWKG